MLKKITSLQHPIVKHLVRLRQNRDYRYEHKSVLIEGKKTISELSQSHLLKTLLVSDEQMIPKKSSPNETVVATEEIIQKISGMQSPEGMIAEIAMPKFVSLNGLQKIIALDHIGDPGNTGAILRTALALGWEGAFILNDSCDPFNEKALRAARGATFRLPLGMGTWEDLKKIVDDSNLLPLAADIRGEEVGKVKHQGKVLLVLSNEAHGLSEQASNLCQRVTIPMPGPMESLNVSIAGAILMYLLREVP